MIKKKEMRRERKIYEKQEYKWVTKATGWYIGF
jgi:hypothetical protein